jgi:hypothetical protein
MIIFSKTLSTAKITAALRPRVPIYCFTYDENSLRKSNILF